MSDINVSYVVPVFNSAMHLSQAVDSILDGNFIPGDEILIVDDGSTDDSVAIAKSYCARNEAITLLKHNVNRGSAAAGRNTGIEHANNELIFCLDSDNLLRPNSVEVLRRLILDKNLDAIAFGEIHFFSADPTSIDLVWIFSEKMDFYDCLNNSKLCPLSSGNYLFRRAMWLKVGRMNEFVGKAVDSEIFGLSLLAEGAHFGIVPGTSYLHRHGHQSAYVLDSMSGRNSLNLLIGLLKYGHLINEADLIWMLRNRKWDWRSKKTIRSVASRRFGDRLFLLVASFLNR